MMDNSSRATTSPHTPVLSESLTVQPDLLPFVADQHLPYLLPIITYWVLGLTFHSFDVYGLFSKYKTHTPAEFLKRNHATRCQVLKFALIQQVAQALAGYLLSGGHDIVHTHEYNLVMWTRRVHLAGVRLAHLFATKPFVLLEDGANFTKSEAALASALYWIIIPAIQFAVALFLADTWQYFTHRLFHQNRFLYKHVHSMHHEIHVNFAWGAFYNHPAETILIDVIGFPICLQIAQLSTRQATVAAVVWTIKTVVDHCGYAFPYDPCNLICPQSQWFHDLHHQTWGMKHNFSTYTQFWDYVLGTMWVASDTKAQGKYAKAKEQAEAQMEKSHAGNSAITSGTSTSVSREI